MYYMNIYSIFCSMTTCIFAIENPHFVLENVDMFQQEGDYLKRNETKIGTQKGDILPRVGYLKCLLAYELDANGVSSPTVRRG